VFSERLDGDALLDSLSVFTRLFMKLGADKLNPPIPCSDICLKRKNALNPANIAIISMVIPKTSLSIGNLLNLCLSPDPVS
jgi:hypothetical protein